MKENRHTYCYHSVTYGFNALKSKFLSPDLSLEYHHPKSLYNCTYRADEFLFFIYGIEFVVKALKLTEKTMYDNLDVQNFLDVHGIRLIHEYTTHDI